MLSLRTNRWLGSGLGEALGYEGRTSRRKAGTPDAVVSRVARIDRCRRSLAFGFGAC
jgi:hypothetical protein